MTVDLAPAEVVAAIVGGNTMEERILGKEYRAGRHYPQGTIYFKAASNGLLLWRCLHVDGHPDVMVLVEIEAVPRGSRIVLSSSPHSNAQATRSALAGVVGATAVGCVVVAATQSLYSAIVLALLCALPFTPLVRDWVRLRRQRHTLRPLLEWAYEALTPHEIGPSDLDGSAFRASPGGRSITSRRR